MSQPPETPKNPQFFQAVELTTATYDRAARNYAERNERRMPHWTERMEQFMDLLARNAGEHPLPEVPGRPGDEASLEEFLQFVPVLDAGCGPGRDARALADYDLPVLGVDLSQGMLDEAGERTARRLPRGSIRYALMDMRQLELPDGACRGVWCSASLLHVPRAVAPRAVGELARVARVGAPVVILLKERAEHGPAEELAPYPFPEVTDMPRYFAYYTKEEAYALVAGAGLDIIDASSAPDERMQGANGWVSVVARKR